MAYKIAPDKKKHFWVGLPLGLLLQVAVSVILHLSPVTATLLSFLALAAICYGFELLSLVTGKGHADNMDAIAGILGGILGIGIYWGIHAIV